MDTNSAVTTTPRSKTLYVTGLVAALIFLVSSQIMQSWLIPASGTVPSPAMITTGVILTVLGVASTLVMVYAMMLRRKGS